LLAALQAQQGLYLSSNSSSGGQAMVAAPCVAHQTRGPQRIRRSPSRIER
jgi:hypothetical protein